MQIRGHDIGVCSWSLQPKDVADLVAKVKSLGLEHLQMELGRLLDLDDAALQQALSTLRDSGIQLTAGMIGFAGEDYAAIAIIRQTGGYLPDGQWAERLERTKAAARLGAGMGLRCISTHIGFVPPSSDPKYQVMVGRVGQVADLFQELGLMLLLETGQEHAPELLQFLNDLAKRNVRVNFDPANMILYGAGDPIEAIETLGRHIGHVHVKDATRSSRPAVNWGEEVPFGTGEVPVRDFLNALDRAKYTGPLVIEREAGNQRLADVKQAIDALRKAQ